jgi:hypothetical protein
MACADAEIDANCDKSESAAAFNPKSDISDGTWALIEPIVALSCAEALAESMATPIALAPPAAAAANASLAEAVAESAGKPKAIAADA